MDSALRLLRALTRLEAGLAALALTVLVCILAADVVAVDVFSTGVRAAPQIAVLSNILACMLGLTLATSAGAHFRPTFADWCAPFTWADRLGDAISAVLFAAFSVVSVDFVLQSRSYADRVPVLGLPLWPLQVIVPYVLASCAIKHAVFALSPKTKDALSEGAQ